MKRRRRSTDAKLVALGTAMRTTRIAKKLSLRELAARCRISHRDLKRIERGQVRLRILTLTRIARALSVSVARLFRAAKL